MNRLLHAYHAGRSAAHRGAGRWSPFAHSDDRHAIWLNGYDAAKLKARPFDWKRMIASKRWHARYAYRRLAA